MTKPALLSAAAFVAASAIATPAFAQHRVAAHPANAYAYAQAGQCAYHDPGNPYSKYEDYQGWSAWRSRGGWDDRVDPNCGYGTPEYPSSGL